MLCRSCERTINLFLNKNKVHDVLLLPGRSFDSRLNLESGIVVHADGSGIVPVNVEDKFLYLLFLSLVNVTE